jgi:hypothetical protein
MPLSTSKKKTQVRLLDGLFARIFAKFHEHQESPFD